MKEEAPATQDLEPLSDSAEQSHYDCLDLVTTTLTDRNLRERAKRHCEHRAAVDLPAARSSTYPRLAPRVCLLRSADPGFVYGQGLFCLCVQHFGRVVGETVQQNLQVGRGV